LRKCWLGSWLLCFKTIAQLNLWRQSDENVE
jgi:hypothetical protein